MEKIKALILIIALLCVSSHAEAKRKKSKRSQKETVAKQQKPPDFETAEVKALVEESSIDSFVAWIKTVDSTFEQQRVFFFDTSDLNLNKNGIILRVRRMHDETYDSSSKLRATEITEIPVLRGGKKSGKLQCEVDAVVGGPQLQSCSITQTSKKVLPSVDSQNVETYFSRDQSQLVRSKISDLKWKDLKVFGPIIASEWNTTQNGLDFSCELWALPNKKRFLECSSRNAVKEVTQTQAKLLDFLKSKNFKTKESAQNKTELALSDFK